MKIIGVTGGTGFIGSYFLRDYSEKYDFVVATSKESVDNPIKGVRYKKCDYSEKSFEEIFYGCDAVVHLGARIPTSVIGFGSVKDYSSNILTTESLLKASVNLGIRKFIDISSVAVYDKSTVILHEEDAYTPRNAYGISKAASEIMVKAYADEYSFDAIILRFAQVIGYKKWEHRCFFSMLQEYPLIDKEICIFGKGDMYRDIIYVKDIARALDAAIECDVRLGIYNIGTGKGTSNLNLAKAFIEAYNSKSQIKMLMDKTEDQRVWYCDITSAEKELGFVPHYDCVSMAHDIRMECLSDNCRKNIEVKASDLLW